MASRFVMTSSVAWLESWAPHGSLYNCSTFTFDVGSVTDQNAEEIRVAVALVSNLSLFCNVLPILLGAL